MKTLESACGACGQFFTTDQADSENLHLAIYCDAFDFASYYLERITEASKEQGIDDLIEELAKHGIKATSEQTGGFTMCAYFKLKGDRYIYANPYGAGVYDSEDGFKHDIIQLDDPNIQEVAKAIADWIKSND